MKMYTCTHTNRHGFKAVMRSPEKLRRSLPKLIDLAFQSPQFNRVADLQNHPNNRVADLQNYTNNRVADLRNHPNNITQSTRYKARRCKRRRQQQGREHMSSCRGNGQEGDRRKNSLGVRVCVREESCCRGNYRVLCSLLHKYSCSWRRVQPNVSWNCLAKACAEGTILLTPGLKSAFRFSFPLFLRFLLYQLAGMGVNCPDANFLVTLLGGLQFQPVQCFSSFLGGLLSAHILQAEFLGKVSDESFLDCWPCVNSLPAFGGAEPEQNNNLTNPHAAKQEIPQYRSTEMSNTMTATALLLDYKQCSRMKMVGKIKQEVRGM